MHFVEGGLSIDQLSLDTFYGPGIMIDLTHIDEDSPITARDLSEALNGYELQSARIFLRTNWNQHYGEADYAERSPYISVEAVDWLAAHRPALVSYDYAHAKDEPGAPAPFYAVRTFVARGIVTMGYVTRLDEIDAGHPFVVSAFPLAFRGVESSPVRAVLIQDGA
jgi:kynurenine formamidase